jgi:putative sigma-54 modulation protein
MKIEIQARHFSLTEALQKYTNKKLHLAIDCCDAYVRRVIVRLSDVNGPKGGVDKRCQIQIILDGLAGVVIEDTKVDLYAAINGASERAGQALLRKIERQKTIKRQRHQQVLLKEDPLIGDIDNVFVDKSWRAFEVGDIR